MLSPRDNARFCLVLLALLLVTAGRPAVAGPPTPPPSAPAPVRALPDYGGRESGLGSALDGGSGGAQPPLNPLAQAGRAFEALVVVLACVVGGLFLLKRSGVLQGAAPGQPFSRAFRLPPAPSAPGTAATELLSVLGSQALPQSPGAGLHLVSAGGRLLLVGATSQSVTLLTELDGLPQTPAEDTPEERAAFEDYLARVGVPTAEAGRAPASLTGATERLQSLLARRESEQDAGARRTGG